MTDPNLCFDVWTVRQLESDDMGGQENWDNDDSVNYRQTDNDNDGNEDGQAGTIERYNNENEMFEDAKNFAGQLIGSFISLAF